MVRSLEHYNNPNLLHENAPIYHFNKWLKIKKRVKQYIKDYLKYFEASEDALTHSMSESPICNVMEEKTFPLPLGFKIIPYSKGIVHVYDDNQKIIRRDIQHVYAKNGDYILCVSFSQFFDDQYSIPENNVPGERIRRYKELAPSLVHDFGDGIAVLFGSREQIKKQLHLQYK